MFFTKAAISDAAAKHNDAFPLDGHDQGIIKT